MDELENLFYDFAYKSEHPREGYKTIFLLFLLVQGSEMARISCAETTKQNYSLRNSSHTLTSLPTCSSVVKILLLANFVVSHSPAESNWIKLILCHWIVLDRWKLVIRENRFEFNAFDDIQSMQNCTCGDLKTILIFNFDSYDSDAKTFELNHDNHDDFFIRE